MRNGKNPQPFRRKVADRLSFEAIWGEVVLLPPVSVDHNPSFFEVVLARQSSRTFRPLSLLEISNVLWYSAKVKAVKLVDGDILTRRRAPSAGAVHPIDVFVSPFSIDERFLYYYDPFKHCLRLMKLDALELRKFFNHLHECVNIDNATIIWFIGDLHKTSAFYKNASSLVWRDAGALISTFQFVATALNIGSCAIGTLGKPYISELFKSTRKGIISAGGLLLG